ncbi:related to Type 2A phosphatase-associated protein 42 [Saccharomycodes ludwigii]|uniref:Related to Type 2A phosphatase-associated protein 42 n=1 Tax=Saccharomycodes ludwigii TaxID=36035 RepID=A0A376B162_9ASCO|nr:related to Type 2A phosphatase-associated protein 42 [Saccharomycodes ludwigii]
MSLLQEYNKLIHDIETKILKTTIRQDTKEFQDELSSIFNSLLTLKQKIFNNLALFSENEQLEDVPTANLKYLTTDYYLALLLSKKQAVVPNLKTTDTATSFSNSDSFYISNRNKIKLGFLTKSVQLYMQFLVTLSDYEILDDKLIRKINSFNKTYSPTLEELSGVLSSSKQLSPEKKRNWKIEIFKSEKEVAEKVKLLEEKFKLTSKENDVDDELLREVYVNQLKQLSYKAYSAIEGNLYESEFLKNFSTTDAITEANQKSHDQERSTKDKTGYTERLETLNKPLLSKNGKVLRNFTLLDKKDQLKSQVFGHGQYGPTMTVEEFLDNEFASGRVLQGGEEKLDYYEDEQNEDNENWADRQTYKAREWDNFTESHAKGSGNTMNRG